MQHEESTMVQLNRKQLGVLWTGLALIVGMCMYVPWNEAPYVAKYGSAEVRIAGESGYALIFGLEGEQRIDAARLAVQCGLVVMILSALLLSLRGPPAIRKPEESDIPQEDGAYGREQASEVKPHGRRWVAPQRVAIVLGALAGMSGTFLPFVSFGASPWRPQRSVSGTAGMDGWLSLACFGIVVVLAVLGRISRQATGGHRAAVVLFCLLPSALATVKIGQIYILARPLRDNPAITSGQVGGIEIGTGLFVILVAGVATAILAYAVRDRPREHAESLARGKGGVSPPATDLPDAESLPRAKDIGRESGKDMG